jgi:hypothetical protein
LRYPQSYRRRKVQRGPQRICPKSAPE